MFTVYCSGHGNRVLLFPDDIEELVNCPGATELHWRCSCGTKGTTLIRHTENPLQQVA